ncbi:IS3 family transposase [Roseibium aggregatum]|uniref:IS3 family transposase n=1 Tax=Roseibium aggregatum TaxID=187304 RepID=UPI003A97C3CA
MNALSVGFHGLEKSSVTPGAKREVAAYLCTGHGVSQRRACAVFQVDRSGVQYQSTRAPEHQSTRPDDWDVREATKKIANERRRFGYRRIHIMLVRQGIVVNQKKLRRLYAEEKLQVAQTALSFNIPMFRSHPLE